MNIKFIISILLPFLALQIQAQNYKYHTTFSNISQTALPPDWNINGDSHQFTIDSLNRDKGRALKICGVRDSIAPSILTLTTLPVNRENSVTFSMRVRTQSENDSLLMVVSAMDTMAMQWIRGSIDWKDYTVSIPLSNNSQIMVPQLMFPSTGPYWISETTVEMTKRHIRPKMTMNLMRARLLTQYPPIKTALTNWPYSVKYGGS